MNKKIYVAIAAAVFGLFFATLNAKKNLDHDEYFAAEFPDLDIEVVRLAHKKLFREVLCSKRYVNIDWNEQTYNAAIREVYADLKK